MKIRMGFVTNSSGSSYTSIEIENKELCKILNKYVNEINNQSKKKIEIPEITEDKILDYSSWGDEGSKNAFWNGDFKELETIPSAFEKDLSKKIKPIKNKEINKILDEMRKELQEKEELINKSYNKITEQHHYSGDLGGCASQSIYTEYNANNKCPKCGSPLIYSRDDYQHDEYDKNKKTYIQVEEKKEQLECSNKNCDFKAYNRNI